MNYEFAISVLVAGVAIIVMVVFTTKCEQKRLEIRGQIIEECIKTTGKPLECRHSIMQREMR